MYTHPIDKHPALGPGCWNACMPGRHVDTAYFGNNDSNLNV